jgi:hypothetical protein
MIPDDSRRRALYMIVAAALLLVALACTCGPLTTLSNARATASAAKGTAEAVATQVGEHLPTLQAAATDVSEYLPTLQAGATQYGPLLDATTTAVVATADALGGGVPDVAIPDLAGDALYDGGDGLQTTTINPIDPGQSATARLDNVFYAHNWLLVGVAGQTVTVRVNGAEGADPYLKLIDQHGNVVAEDDDGGGDLNALIALSLPETGLYTLRVTVHVPGAYTISVE